MTNPDILSCLSDTDNELFLMYFTGSAPDTSNRTADWPEAGGVVSSSAVERHDLVYVPCRKPAVQVAQHLHRCVVDSSVWPHNCAGCPWSLSWHPQTLHADTSLYL